MQLYLKCSKLVVDKVNKKVMQKVFKDIIDTLKSKYTITRVSCELKNYHEGILVEIDTPDLDIQDYEVGDYLYSKVDGIPVRLSDDGYDTEIPLIEVQVNYIN